MIVLQQLLTLIKAVDAELRYTTRQILLSFLGITRLLHLQFFSRLLHGRLPSTSQIHSSLLSELNTQYLRIVQYPVIADQRTAMLSYQGCSQESKFTWYYKPVAILSTRCEVRAICSPRQISGVRGFRTSWGHHHLVNRCLSGCPLW